MRINQNELPVLDTAFITEIFAYALHGDLSKEMPEQKQNFFKMLYAMMDYNYSYRRRSIEKVAPLVIEAIEPIEMNSEGPTFYIALGLAIKDLYGLSLPKFREVMNLVIRTQIK